MHCMIIAGDGNEYHECETLREARSLLGPVARRSATRSATIYRMLPDGSLTDVELDGLSL